MHENYHHFHFQFCLFIALKLWHKPIVFMHKWKTNQNVHAMCCVWRRLYNVTSCFCLFYLLFFTLLLTRESMFCSMKPKKSLSLYLTESNIFSQSGNVCFLSKKYSTEKWHLALFSYLQLIKAPAFCFISSRALVDIESWQRTLMIEGGSLKKHIKMIIDGGESN